MNEIFLGDIDIIPRLQSNVVNLIYAPVGVGKSTWVKENLVQSVSDKREILYLIDTTAGRDQNLHDNDETLTEHSKEWDKYMNYIPNKGWGDWKELPEDKVVIMTYSKMAHLIAKNGNRFGVGYLKHIVLDEAHNLKIYQSYDKEKDSVLKILESWIKDVMKISDIKITALSATPKMIFKMFDAKIINEVLTETEVSSLRTLKTIETRHFASMQNTLSHLPKGRGIIYTSHIRTMKKYADIIADSSDTRNVEMIWSRNNEKHLLSDRQWEIWDSILWESKIPDETDILMLNASCQCGINIETPVDFYVIDEWDDDVITQARGRVRKDLPLLLLPGDVPDYFHLPSELLGIPIYQEDKDRVIECINRRNDGHLKRWLTVSKLIKDSDSYRFQINPNNGNDYFRDYSNGIDRRYRIIKLNA